MNDQDAGSHIQHAYGALADLADLVGIEPSQIAHGKKLAIAFGARGSGRASAHYEPDRAVINLTHTRGGGSLAHEWAHFMDHVMSGGTFAVEGMRRRMAAASHGETAAQVHPDVQRAFADVMRVIKTPSAELREELQNRTNQAYSEVEHARNLDAMAPRGTEEHAARRKEWQEASDRYKEARKQQTKHRGSSKFATHAELLGDYWVRPHEMFARAFESWAEDKLEAAKRKNTYLVVDTQRLYNVTRKTRDGGTAHGLEPYPQGAERKVINGAIDRLVESLARTKELQKGVWKRVFNVVSVGGGE